MAQLDQLSNFKTLTVENWRKVDRVVTHFIPPNVTAHAQDAGDAWANAILKSKLSERVPGEVRQLFHVAQGTMVYGFFFYPLFALGSEQSFRVLEAALRYKCRVMNAPANIKTFDGMLKWMKSNDFPIDYERWHGARELRNAASHPNSQLLVTPSMALRDLEILVQLIDDLFGAPNPPL